MRDLTMLLVALLLLLPLPALAYVGPGLGLGALAVLGGIALSVLIALLALFWYPLKRLLGRRRNAGPEVDGGP